MRIGAYNVGNGLIATAAVGLITAGGMMYALRSPELPSQPSQPTIQQTPEQFWNGLSSDDKQYLLKKGVEDLPEAQQRAYYEQTFSPALKARTQTFLEKVTGFATYLDLRLSDWREKPISRARQQQNHEQLKHFLGVNNGL